MHCLSAPTGRPAHPDESKYVKIFQNVDLSSNLYFRSVIILLMIIILSLLVHSIVLLCLSIVHNNKCIDNCNSDIYTTVHLHTYMNLFINLSGELLHF